jgi:hypothetical protein
MMENIRLLGEPIRLLIHKKDEAMKGNGYDGRASSLLTSKVTRVSRTA